MRFVVRFLLALMFVLALVWLGLWWYAEGRMQSGVAAWADQVAAKGGEVSYDSLKRGTSPLSAAVVLTDLRVTLPPRDGQNAVLTLPSLALRIGLLQPLLLHIDLPNRVNVQVNALDAVIAFGSIAQTEQLDPHELFNNQPYPFRAGDLTATQIDVLASQGSLLVLHIDNLVAHGAFNRNAGPRDVALDDWFSADGIGLSPLMTHLLSIPFGGRLAHLAETTQLSGPVPAGLPALAQQLNALPPADMTDLEKQVAPVAHAWATAGGNGRFTLAATLGPSTATAAGNVKFDANVQPQGTADLSADHLDQLTAELTNAYPALQDTVAQLEARLSPYLTSSGQGGQTLAAHLAYDASGVRINGQAVAPMPVVNWDALENPPPPASP